MPENARSAIMEAEGREPKALGQTFEISARHPFGTAPFGWGISANGIYGLNVPEDPAIDFPS